MLLICPLSTTLYNWLFGSKTFEIVDNRGTSLNIEHDGKPLKEQGKDKNHLVGGWPTPLKKMMEFVSWDDEIQLAAKLKPNCLQVDAG